MTALFKHAKYLMNSISPPVRQTPLSSCSFKYHSYNNLSNPNLRPPHPHTSHHSTPSPLLPPPRLPPTLIPHNPHPIPKKIPPQPQLILPLHPHRLHIPLPIPPRPRPRRRKRRQALLNPRRHHLSPPRTPLGQTMTPCLLTTNSNQPHPLSFHIRPFPPSYQL